MSTHSDLGSARLVVPQNHDSAEPKKADSNESVEHGVERSDLLRIGFVCLAAAAVWFRVWEPFSRFSVIGITATLVGGYPIFKEAYENVVERKMTMELSMTIALVSALLIGEYFTALVITGFFLAAEVLEGLTVGRGRRAISSVGRCSGELSRGQDLSEVILSIIAELVRLADLVMLRPAHRCPHKCCRRLTKDALLTRHPSCAGSVGHSGAQRGRRCLLG